MAERITIAELNIDDSALLRSTAAIREELDNLRNAQRRLDRTTEEGRQQFVRNDAAIRSLSRTYNQNRNALAQRTRVVQDAEQREEMLNMVLGEEVTTIEEARAQTQILTRLRNQTNATTEEGAALIAQLNEQLDRNTEFVRENADGFLRLRLNIGNYAEGMQEALQNLNPLNGGLTGFIQRSQEAGGVTNLLTQSLGSAARAFVGLTQSALAFLATPIGLVIAAIVAAFLLVQNALNRSEEATNQLRVAMGAITGILNAVLRALQPLGEFLINGIVAGFELAAQAANRALNIISGALRSLGFEDAADSVDEFTESMNEAAEAGRALARAENELTAARRRARLVQLEFQRDAERLRQIRDDDRRTFPERIAANERLGQVLREQLQQELAIAQQALTVANLRIQAEGSTRETLDAQAEALTEIADIQERITGQESEQLTNRNQLLREAAQLEVERLEALNETFREQNRLTAQTARETLAIERQAAANEIEILETKLANRLIREEQFNLEVLRIRNRLIEMQREIDTADLERERAFEQRRDELRNNIRVAREEEGRAREELELQLEFERNVAELERLNLQEEEKTQLLRLLEEERGLVLQEIRNRFTQESLDALRSALEQENRIRQQQGDASVSIQRSIAGALTGLLGDSLAARLAALTVDAVIQVANIEATTAAAQATNLAQAAAAAPPPLNIPFITTAIAQNTAIQANSTAQIARVLTSAAVQGVTTTLGTFRQGGLIEIQGASHEHGGVPIYAGNQYIGEAEGGEGIGILNKAAFSDFMGYNNSFNAGTSSGGKFQGGGIITQVVNPAQNTGDIVEGVAEAIGQMRIQVAVEDINTGQQNFAEVVNEANLG